MLMYSALSGWVTPSLNKTFNTQDEPYRYKSMFDLSGWWHRFEVSANNQ